MIEGTPSDKPKLKAVKEQPPTKKQEQVGFYFRYFIPSEDGRIKIVDVPQYKLMADHCFEQKNMCFDDAASYKYDGKKWKWLSKTALTNFIINSNEECIKPAHIDPFAKIIKGKCLQDSIGLEEAQGLVNVNNGVVKVMTGEIVPHSYKYFFKYVVNLNYDPKAECPLWENFLLSVFEGEKTDSSKRALELINIVQRLFGYILIGGEPFLHRAFVLHGEGRNGKSTFLDILRAVIGSQGYSTVSMAKLDKEFSIVAMDGMLANIVEETPTDEINSEVFKAMVGGGEVQAAHKGFDEFRLRCHARFVFACNEMPIFKDKSIGLEDRLVFIPFNRYFAEHERDTNIKTKLLGELPGILNWSIEGAKKILADRSIPNCDATKEAKEVYRQDTDPLYAWFCENIEVVAVSPEQMTPSSLYKRYCDDLKSSGNKAYSKDKFFKRFRKLLSSSCADSKIEYNPNERNKSARYFKNVKYIGESIDKKG